MFINGGKDKEDVVSIQNGILISHKKNEIMPSAATGMDLVIIRLREVSQTKKDKFPMVSNYMWNLIKMLQNNLFKNITKLTDFKINLMVTIGETIGGKRRIGRVALTYTHHCIKQMINQNIL